MMERGEVWLATLNSEDYPVVIVNESSLSILSLRIVVPLLPWLKEMQAPWRVTIDPSEKNGLKDARSADTYQVRSISKDRLTKYLGELSTEDMNKIDQALCVSLDLHEKYI